MYAWMYHGGGHELMQRVLQEVQHPFSFAVRQHRRADGRLVPQGDQDGRRHEGPEVPHRRLRRQDPGRARRACRSRSPAATSIRRWRRARSTPPNGSARTTTRSSASTRSPSTTTTPAGGKAARTARLYVNNEGLGDAAAKHTRRCVETAAGLRHVVDGARSTTPATRRRCAGWWRPAPSFGRSRARCSSRASPRPTSSMTSSSAKDPKFKKIYDSLKAFRDDQNLWFRVAENTFDNFNFSMSAAGSLTVDDANGKAPPAPAGLFVAFDRWPLPEHRRGCVVAGWRLDVDLDLGSGRR